MWAALLLALGTQFSQGELVPSVQNHLSCTTSDNFTELETWGPSESFNGGRDETAEVVNLVQNRLNLTERNGSVPQALIAREGSGSLSSAASQEPSSNGCQPMDFTKLDQFLKKFVSPHTIKDGINSTLLDYQAALSDEESMKDLDDFIVLLGLADVSGCSLSAKLAFWANAYNALIIRLVLKDAQKQHGKLTASIQDIKCGTTPNVVWNCPAGNVAGSSLTLEEVLWEASKLKDPRIHAAVNCASLSCPDLRPEAYNAANIDAQLNEQVSAWLNNPTKGAKVEQGDDGIAIVRVSKIFDWHEEDFPDPEGFLASNLGLRRDQMRFDDFLEYNWSLNCVPAQHAGAD